MEESRMQRSILKYIDQNFARGSVRKELVGDLAVKIVDRNGESMTFTQNLFGDIMDNETKKILAISDLPHNLDKLRMTSMPTSWRNVPYKQEPELKVTYFVSNLNSEDLSWSRPIPIKYPDFESALKRYIDADAVDGKSMGIIVHGEEYVLAKFETDTMRNQFNAGHSFNRPIPTEEHVKLGDNLKTLRTELEKDNAYHVLKKKFGMLTLKASDVMFRQNSERGSWHGKIAVDGRPQDYIAVDITGDSELHQIQYEVKVVRDNVVVDVNDVMVNTNAESFKESIHTTRRAAHRELEGYLREAAGMLETKLNQTFTLYARDTEHLLSEHYELLKASGYEEIPIYKGDKKMANEDNMKIMQTVEEKSADSEPRRYAADEKGNVSRTWNGKNVEEFSKDDVIRFTVETDIKLNGKLSKEVKDMLDKEGYVYKNGELQRLPIFAYEEQLENAYKGFAYVQGNSRPTILTGPSQETVLERVRTWNLTRPDKVKYAYCNIGSLDAETGKYGNWEKYDVGTGKNVSNIYLKLPRMNKDEFEQVKIYLKENGARFNVEKKQWYITPDKADKFKDYLPKEAGTQVPEVKSFITLPKMDKTIFEAVKEELKAQGAKFDWNEKKWFTSPEKVEELQLKVEELAQPKISDVEPEQVSQKQNNLSIMEQTEASAEYNPLYMISGLENPYIVHMLDGSAIRIEQEEILNIAGVKSYPEMNNAKIVDAIERALKERIQVLETDDYYISIKKEMGENKCSICFKDTAKQSIDIYGDSVGLHFPSASVQEIKEAVGKYIKSVETTKNLITSSELSSPEVQGEKIIGYRGIYEKDANEYDCIARVERIEGTLLKKEVSDIHPEKVIYHIQDEQGNQHAISNQEWFTEKQGTVLIRAMKYELTPEAFELIAQHNLSPAQMEAVRNGLQDALPVETVAAYANPKISPGDMDLYRYGLKQGLLFKDLEKLVDPQITGDIPWETKRRTVDIAIRENTQSMVMDLQKNGFRPEKGIMDNMIRLRQITQRANTLQDISVAFNKASYLGTPAGNVIEELGKAFQQQESIKMMVAVGPEM